MGRSIMRIGAVPAVCMSLLLAGCATGLGDQPTPIRTVTPTIEPTSTATPTPTETAAATPCGEVIQYGYPAWSPDGALIAFTTTHLADTSGELDVIEPDGSNLRQLVSNEVDAWPGAWSPDGQRIAFAAIRQNERNLAVVSRDPGGPASPGPAGSGTGLVWLSDVYYGGTIPAWSPDGKQIAFLGAGSDSTEIFVVSSDPGGPASPGPSGSESGLRQLTDNQVVDEAPAWSPDGKRIAFVSMRDGDQDIYVMNAEPGPAGVGSGQTQLTHNDFGDHGPAWSPDPGGTGSGKRIAFESGPAPFSYIVTMTADPGSEQTILTAKDAVSYNPVWSPDDTKIAYLVDADNMPHIYVMDAVSGSNPTRVTGPSVWAESPSWSPDGKRIAYTTFKDTGNEIHVINIDGTGDARLTPDPATRKCSRRP